MRATDPDFGLDFGSNVGIIVADSSGSGYLCIESGTYPISAGIRIGENATYQGGLTVTGEAVLQAKNGNMDIQNGKVVLDNGTIEISKTDKYVSLGNQADGCELHIENGGVLTTSLIRDGNENEGKPSTVFFNGGTLKANGVNSTSWPAIIADKENITVNVGVKGGTIDASGFNIQVGRPIAADGANDGGMTFKGGGSVSLKYANTYTGVTTVEVGTTLVVPEAIAGDKLAFTIPAGFEKGIYEVVRISGGEFADDVLKYAKLPADENAQFRLNFAKTSIICIYGYKKDEVAYVGGNGGNLSVSDNWTTGEVPTRGDVTFDFTVPTTLTVGDKFEADTIIIPASSAVVTIGAGDLQLSGSLTNACKLAIAQGASLTVDGDIVATYNGATFLYSNEGTVTVTGNAVFSAAQNHADIREYAVVTANTQPIKAGGLAYKRDGHNLYAKLQSAGNSAGSWVVGANGLSFPDANASNNSRFYIDGNANATLYSSANWKLANTGLSSTTHGDLQVCNGSLLTIDTTDYTDKTTAHTVTLEGRVKADGNVTIAGCGTVIVNTTQHNGLSETTVASGKTIAVTNTATLKVNADKKILGAGTISLAAGTTLAFESTASTFATPEIVPVTLPAEGAAKINIDGIRLKGGEDHTICTLIDLPDGYKVADHVTITGTALGGRKPTLRIEGGKLLLNIQPSGLMVIIK